MSTEIEINLERDTLKDIDMENLVKGKFLKLDIAESDIDLLLKTIERDIKFLQASAFMDYSLLVGVEKVKMKGPRTESQKIREA